MLLLPRVNDRLRSELTQYPSHPAKLSRPHHEEHFLSRYFGFDAEIALLLDIIIESNVAYDSRAEIGERSDFLTVISQLLAADHARAMLLVSERPAMLRHRHYVAGYGCTPIRLVH